MNKIPHFQIPLNLPHAGTISERILHVIKRQVSETNTREQAKELMALAERMVKFLSRYKEDGENPPKEQAAPIVKRAAEMGRAIVEQIERLRLQDDRLGECIRNFFECLELGEEGAVISLRAGENPGSLQRPI